MHPIRGSLAAVTTSPVTVGSTTYTLASNVKVAGAGHVTTVQQIKTGAPVIIGFNAADQVAWVHAVGH